MKQSFVEQRPALPSSYQQLVFFACTSYMYAQFVYILTDVVLSFVAFMPISCVHADKNSPFYWLFLVRLVREEHRRNQLILTIDSMHSELVSFSMRLWPSKTLLDIDTSTSRERLSQMPHPYETVDLQERFYDRGV